MKGVHCLVVLGAGWDSPALACDFWAVSKTLLDHGLEPTCLSAIDLHSCTQMVPGAALKFGRDDIPGRTRMIYTDEEAVSVGNRFYTKVPERELKERVIRWLKDPATSLQDGDRAIIFLSAHGTPDGSVVMGPSNSQILTKTEIAGQLAVLPKNCRVLFMSNSCWSGKLTTIATDKNPQIPKSTCLFVHAASRPDNKAKNFRSLSGQYRCGVWTAAVIHEMVTDPEGAVSQYVERVEYECANVDINWQQTRTTPTAEFSQRWLRAHVPLSFWKPPVNIATKGPRVAQAQHESWLRSWMGARKFWKTAPKLSPSSAQIAGPGSAQSQNLLQAYNSICEEGDSRLDGFQDYLRSVLENKAPAKLIPLVVNTVRWLQEVELKYCLALNEMHESKLLDDQISSGKIKISAKKEELKNTCDEIRLFLHETSAGFRSLQTPPNSPSNRYIPIFFDWHATDLVDVAARHRTALPSFQLEKLAEILDAQIVVDGECGRRRRRFK